MTNRALSQNSCLINNPMSTRLSNFSSSISSHVQQGDTIRFRCHITCLITVHESINFPSQMISISQGDFVKEKQNEMPQEITSYFCERSLRVMISQGEGAQRGTLALCPRNLVKIVHSRSFEPLKLYQLALV